MRTELDLAFSPCPNDTFIFHHLLKAGSENYTFKETLADVALLNKTAIEKQHHSITKLSFFAMAQLQNQYQLLDCGGALGRGCGPLWISNKKQGSKEALSQTKKILIPGKFTTANLLTQLFLSEKHIDLKKIEFIELRYDKIMQALKNGVADHGIIIHEERFTYQDEGLHKILDLGEWWENTTGHPIPLGCIAARNNLGPQTIAEIEKAIKASVNYAFKNPNEALPFIKKHSQSLEDKVVQSHIELYVNDYSLGYKEDGNAAIAELFKRATLLSS